MLPITLNILKNFNDIPYSAVCCELILLNLNISGKVHFDVRLMPGTGSFEIQEGGALVASGRVTSPESTDITQTVCDVGTLQLKSSDIYKELRLRGYDYGPTFQGILKANLTGTIFN